MLDTTDATLGAMWLQLALVDIVQQAVHHLPTVQDVSWPGFGILGSLPTLVSAHCDRHDHLSVFSSSSASIFI